MVLARLCRSSPAVIATGGGAVLRAENRRLLADHGFVVYLDVDLDCQLRRLANDRARPLLQRPDRREVLRHLGAERAPLYAEVADLRFETGSGSVRQAAERLALVGQLRDALRKEAFSLVYQPILRLADDRLVALEALLPREAWARVNKLLVGFGQQVFFF